MGEKQVFQPLTTEDTITVVLYRLGILISTIIMCGLAFLLVTATSDPGAVYVGTSADILAYCLSI
jgi:hypothetical protein